MLPEQFADKGALETTHQARMTFHAGYSMREMVEVSVKVPLISGIEIRGDKYLLRLSNPKDDGCFVQARR